MLIGFDRVDFNAEFLASRPTNYRTIDKYRRVLARKKDTEGDDRSGGHRMCPINPPPIEGEIPSDTASLEGIAGIIDRTLDGKTTKGSHVEADAGSSRHSMGH